MQVQAGLHRNDTRSILGLRWEHNLDNNTIWRTQVVLDDKNNIQPTSPFGFHQDEPAINVISDVTSLGTFFGSKSRVRRMTSPFVASAVFCYPGQIIGELDFLAPVQPHVRLLRGVNLCRGSNLPIAAGDHII